MSFKERSLDLLPNNTILCGFRGSVAHGTFVPSDDPNSIDDIDTIGVYVNPVEHYLGFRRKKSESVDKWDEELDVVGHELRKYVGLLLNNNPNVMDLLWLPDSMILHSTEEGERLRENRDLFVSKEAFYAFRGYAQSEYDRIREVAGQGYMGEKRKKLVEKHGYDRKKCSAVYKLLTDGIRFLNYGEIVLPHPEASTIKMIKTGRMSYDEVTSKIESLLDELERAHDNSTLPEYPQKDKVEQLLISLLMSKLNLSTG